MAACVVCKGTRIKYGGPCAACEQTGVLGGVRGVVDALRAENAALKARLAAVREALPEIGDLINQARPVLISERLLAVLRAESGAE